MVNGALLIQRSPATSGAGAPRREAWPAAGPSASHYAAIATTTRNARHRFSARPVAPEEARQIDAWWRASRKDLLLRALRWKPRQQPPR